MTVHDCFSIAYLWWQSLLFLHLLHCRTLKPLALWGIHKLWHHSTSSLDSPHGWVLMTGARSTDRNESPCLVVLNAAYCSLKLACEPALVSAFWKVPETFRLSNGDLHFPNLWDHGLFKPSTNMVHVIVCVCVRYWYRKQRTHQLVCN